MSEYITQLTACDAVLFLLIWLVVYIVLEVINETLKRRANTQNEIKQYRAYVQNGTLKHRTGVVSTGCLEKQVFPLLVKKVTTQNLEVRYVKYAGVKYITNPGIKPYVYWEEESEK